MKLAVVSANSKAGNLIVDEAVKGNHIRQRISVVKE
jgi:putative NADH-flavin reductase